MVSVYLVHLAYLAEKADWLAYLARLSSYRAQVNHVYALSCGRVSEKECLTDSAERPREQQVNERRESWRPRETGKAALANYGDFARG